MSKPIVFYRELGVGYLELPRDDGSPDLIPSWLVDRPDVLAALQLIAKTGGTGALKRARDDHDVFVDLDAGVVSFRKTD